MRAQKPKQKSPQDWNELKSRGARFWHKAMRFLFGVSPGWHRQLDVIRNNYELGLYHFRSGHAQDAWLRFSLVGWFSPSHADARYYLGRTEIMRGRFNAGRKALQQAASLNASRLPSPQALLAALPVLQAEGAPPVVVSQITSDSVPTLAAIHHDAFVLPWGEKSFSETLATPGTYGLTAGLAEIPIGFILARGLPDEQEILTLAVSPEWRGRGLAKQLLEKMLDSARQAGAKSVFLEVSVENKLAEAFYRRVGFVVVSRRKDYYRKPDGTMADALVMRKELV